MDVRVGLWRNLSAEELNAFELWCWRRLLRVPWIQPVHPKGDQSWVFIGRTDAEAKTPILWPPHAKSWLIGKDPDTGRDWGQEEKGTTENEMAGWHHWLDGCESEWTPGVGKGQRGLACCDPWGRRELDTTEWLNWTELNIMFLVTFMSMYILWQCHLNIYVTILLVAIKWLIYSSICFGFLYSLSKSFWETITHGTFLF